DPIDVLGLVNITAPEQDATVSGGTLEASGVGSSFEANMLWEIRQGDQVVLDGFATAEGWMDKLYPWEASIDVAGLEPGDYTFVARTDDPSGGAEGSGPHEDTKDFSIK
ncbi:MAG: Gmad2 immunoglobulin-like domain-containing protein, partial [Nocardioides sp.]|uniref:Gmad2 immunoglobulin-like domain-containing protein n=1 Tax=Nocardioides sp. TaxID=35761 RepID=UPI003263EE7B